MRKDERWVDKRYPQDLTDFELIRQRMQRKTPRYFYYKAMLAVSEWWHGFWNPLTTWEFTLQGVYSARTVTARGTSNIRVMTEQELVDHFSKLWDEPVRVMSWKTIEGR